MVDPRNSLTNHDWGVMLHPFPAQVGPQKKPQKTGWLMALGLPHYKNPLVICYIAMENSPFMDNWWWFAHIFRNTRPIENHAVEKPDVVRCDFPSWWRKPPSFGEVADLHDISCILLLGLAQHIVCHLWPMISPWNISSVSSVNLRCRKMTDSQLVSL